MPTQQQSRLVVPPRNPNTGYILYDRFNVDKAAGSVNGTFADTGQARIVTDTNSKLSISGGVASFATGGVGAGDPGLWYPAVTTVLGRMVIVEITPGSTGPGCAAGWDSNQSGLASECIRFIASNVIGWVISGASVSVGAFTSGSTYKIILVQAGAGFYAFIKGGSEYPNITSFGRSGATAPGTLFPVIEVATGTAGVFTADNIRIPTALYIPPQLAVDTFTRSNGALGSTETTGSDGQVLTALAWSTPTGTWAITSNKAGASALSGGLAIATIPVTTKDNLIDAALTRAGGIVGVVGRYTDASNYIYAYHDGTNAGVKQRLAAVETDLIAATAATFVADAVIRMVMDGNSVILFYNNVRIGGTGTINAGLSGAVDGLYTTNTGNTFDGVTSMPRGTSGEFASLDAL